MFTADEIEEDAEIANIELAKVASELKDGQVLYIRLQKGENCPVDSIHVKSPWTGKLETHDFADDGSLTLTGLLSES